MKAITRFFDRLEDKVRARLSHRSIIYGFVGGIATVVFWRGVWHSSDILMDKGGILGWIFYEPNTIIWSSIILLMTGLFVATFIGERIIISGLKQEKKATDKTEEEVKKEDSRIEILSIKIEQLSKNIEEIKNSLKK
ncbi:MAG: hypothetical protein NTU76_03240 [Candidatus Taylorbacteria bacterium]|nr:hypothetical protein [Candidatus Taylorbacteria bacterium]